ncbi:MAG: sensor histidine kinase [Cytophagales bacterium]|nr:sensor histidine kinase [Cytophagales bacterium]
MNRLQQIILHLAGWAIFITLPIILFPGPRDMSGFLNGPAAVSILVGYGLLIIYFYLNYHWLTPRYYFNKKYWRLGLITVGIYLVIAIIPNQFAPNQGLPLRTVPMQAPPANFGAGPEAGLRPAMPPPEPSLLREISFRFGRPAVPFALVLLFSLILRINDRLRQAEAARQKAEIAYLHAQINPHFLFNTLNSIYALALQKAESTAPAVVKLSNMMRYVLTEAIHDKVILAKELNYLKDYIELQRLRLPESVTLSVTIDTPKNGEQIAPMLMVPFIENAFKYGVNPEHRSEISIRITLEYHVIFFEIKNQKVSAGPGGNTQVGIKNACQRLQLLYPQKHTLEIKQSETEFSVYLSILLT